MIRDSIILAGVLNVIVAAAGYAATHQQASASSGLESPAQIATAAQQQRFLVLRGGQVFKGKITRAADRYHVQLPYGEIVVRAVEVESCCRSLDEAYCYKRSLMHAGDVYGHIALAKWCLQNGLTQAASVELAAVEEVDPKNPMVAHLQRRVQAALRPPSLHATSTATLQTIPSRRELEQLAKAMPEGAMETFTETIQPLLLNNCSTHDCHGPRSANALRLLRTHPGRAPSRRLTQRNLHAVMQCIDHESPAASPLLTKPIEPHGREQRVIFDEKNIAQYRQLVSWVGAMARHHAVRSLRRPAVANARKAPDARAVLTTLDGVEQVSHQTPWPEVDRHPAAESDEVQPAVFVDPYLPDSRSEKTRGK